MTSNSLSNLITNSSDIALEIFKDPMMDGRFLIFSESDDRKMNALWEVKNSSEEQKNIACNILAGSMALRNTIRYSVMALAWMTIENTKDTDPGKFIPPSKNPNRQEILMVSAVEENGYLAHLFSVVRNESGDIIEFKMHEEPMEGGVMSGLFMRMLTIKKALELAPRPILLKNEDVASQFLLHGHHFSLLNQWKTKAH